MHDVTSDAVIIGVDTHKDVHVAVAINGLGARLATASFPVTSQGYREMAAWAAKLGTVHAFGIEGTGSYGAGLNRALAAMDLRVIEVGRVNRQLRRRHGKTDTVDAESAAWAVLAGEAEGEPKIGDGAVEMIRHLKIAHDTALKARTQAMVTLKTLLVNTPQPLRERFIGITGKMTLIRAIAALRPGKPVSTTASAKVALQALANRWLMLDAEIKEHEAILETLVRAKAPTLMEAPGVSTGTIADMLVVLGDNPQRIRSEAAFAKLCGVCPVPASSGKTSAIALTAGVTAEPTRPCTGSHSSACGIIRRPANKSSAEPPKGSHPAKSVAASNATLPAKSTGTSAPESSCDPTQMPLDQHRSINAMCESFFHILVHQRQWPTREHARRDLFATIEGYDNRRRIHSALGYRTPKQAERQMA